MVAITPTPKIKNLDKLLMHCQRRRHAAKSNIICAGDRSDTLYFIIKGSVTILIEDDDGREMIIAAPLVILTVALINVSVQMSAPRWVTARALSLYTSAITAGIESGMMIRQ